MQGWESRPLSLFIIVCSGMAFLFGTASQRKILFSDPKYKKLFFVGLSGFMLSFVSAILFITITKIDFNSLLYMFLGAVIPIIVVLSFVLPLSPFLKLFFDKKKEQFK